MIGGHRLVLLRPPITVYRIAGGSKTNENRYGSLLIVHGCFDRTSSLESNVFPGTPTESTQPFAEQNHNHFLNYFGYSLVDACPECLPQVMVSSKEDGQLHASTTLV